MIYNAYSELTESLFGLQVKSCGHIFAQHGRTISRPNGREDWLLFYVAKGRERFTLRQEAIAEEGSFLFFRPFERQEHVYIGEKPGEFYYVHFMAPSDFDLFGLESSHIYATRPSMDICTLFEQILNELQRKQSHYEQIAASLFLTLGSSLKRLCDPLPLPRQKYADKISFVIQNMHKEYWQDTSLETYAAMCNMSKYHFLRTFKAITGQAPLTYRNEIRLAHARELLEDRMLTIGEVAERSGYTSPNYFCDAFKKKLGISPQQYRRQQLYPQQPDIFTCKIASLEEMHIKWDDEIARHPGEDDWLIWKERALERCQKGQSIAYYGILSGRIITEGTALLEASVVQNSTGLVDEKTAYLSAFRTLPEYQGKGYFSQLLRYLLQDLTDRGYEKVTLGVEPCEIQNLQIYFHYGFTEYIKTATETYPGGDRIEVLYYGKSLLPG